MFQSQVGMEGKPLGASLSGAEVWLLFQLEAQ